MDKTILDTLVDEAKKNMSKRSTVTLYGFDISVKKTLTLEDVMSISDFVTNTCFTEDSFNPELIDFCIKYMAVQTYSDIELPSNATEIYDILYNTDIVDTIIAKVDTEQLKDVVHSVYEKTRNMAETMNAEVTVRANSIMDDLERTEKMIEEIFADISPDDIGRVIKAVSDGALDENRFVEKYMSSKDIKNN